MFTGVVHRIDKGTSGLLVMAKDATAQAGLQEQFARRSVRRRYLAIVLGTPERETGRIDAPIGRDPKDRLRMVSTFFVLYLFAHMNFVFNRESYAEPEDGR
jgi:23S rRNA-/tRNA-specific pseudouridylate synthase